jgi:glutamate/tyrosine decarboxylase-like PLP-dependent enzyme
LALASEAILVCTRLAECWWRGKKQNKTKQNKSLKRLFGTQEFHKNCTEIL